MKFSAIFVLLQILSYVSLGKGAELPACPMDSQYSIGRYSITTIIETRQKSQPLSSFSPIECAELANQLSFDCFYTSGFMDKIHCHGGVFRASCSN